VTMQALRIVISLLLIHRSISPHSSYCIVNSPVASALQLLRRELFHDLKDGRLEDSLLVLEEGAVYRHLVGEHWIPHTCTRNSSLKSMEPLPFNAVRCTMCSLVYHIL